MNARSEKLLLLVSCILFSITVVLLALNPISQYNLSIFSQINPIMWIMFLFCLYASIHIIIYNTHLNHIGYWFFFAWILLITINSVVILLSSISGYIVPGSYDHLTHIGYVNDITTYSTVSQNNIYPATHILLFIYSGSLNLDIIYLSNYYGFVFYLLNIVFTYILSKKLVSQPAAIISTTISAILLYYHYTELFPMGYAMSLVLMILFVYFCVQNSESLMYKILLIILLASVVYFHLVVAIILALLLMVLALSNLIYTTIFEKSYHYFNLRDFIFPLALISMIVLWIGDSFPIWNQAVIDIFALFNGEALQGSVLEYAQDGSSKLGLDVIDMFILFSKVYGKYVILLVLAAYGLVYVLYAAYRYRSHKVLPKDIHLKNIFQFSILSSIIILLWVIDLFRPLYHQSSGRFTTFTLISLPILSGLALTRIMNLDGALHAQFNIRSNSFSKIIVIFAVFLCASSAIVSLYPSPFIYRSNLASSYECMSGMEWIINHEDKNFEILRAGIAPPGRFVDALYGTYYKRHIANQEHFGDHFEQVLNGDSYLISRNKYLIDLYTGVYSAIAKYTSNDITKLEDKDQANKIYNNSEVQTYFMLL